VQVRFAGRAVLGSTPSLSTIHARVAQRPERRLDTPKIARSIRAARTIEGPSSSGLDVAFATRRSGFDSPGVHHHRAERQRAAVPCMNRLRGSTPRPSIRLASVAQWQSTGLVSRRARSDSERRLQHGPSGGFPAPRLRTLELREFDSPTGLHPGLPSGSGREPPKLAARRSTRRQVATCFARRNRQRASYACGAGFDSPAEHHVEAGWRSGVLAGLISRRASVRVRPPQPRRCA
jgi:hypothetical protein